MSRSTAAAVDLKINANRSTKAMKMPSSASDVNYKHVATSNRDQRQTKLTNPGIRERPIYLQRPSESNAQPSEKISEQTKHTKMSHSQSTFSRVGFSDKLRQ